jgi:hypothetical protein
MIAERQILWEVRAMKRILAVLLILIPASAFGAIGFSTALRNARLDAITTKIQVSAPGFLDIYDGTQPATCGTATTRLAHITLANPAAPAASGGVLTFSAISSSTATGTSTATWARLTDGTGACVMDSAATLTTGAGPVKLTNTSLVSGQTVTVSSVALTEGNP